MISCLPVYKQIIKEKIGEKNYEQFKGEQSNNTKAGGNQ